MSHTPFIIATYSFALVLLSWCAVAPLLHGRRLRKDILSRIEYMDNNDASNS